MFIKGQICSYGLYFDIFAARQYVPVFVFEILKKRLTIALSVECLFRHSQILYLPKQSMWHLKIKKVLLFFLQVIQMFRGCKPEDMPPHVYAVAQTAYRTMLSSRQHQSLVFLGRSGSGKTTCTRHILHFFTVAAGSVNNTLSGWYHFLLTL